MYQYVHELILKDPERYELPEGYVTPAPSYFYDVQDPTSEDVNLLNKKQKYEYHSLMA